MKEVLTIAILALFLASCASSSYCPYAAKKKRTKNLCAAYR